VIRELKSQNSKFERADGWGLPEPPVWFGAVEEVFAVPTRVARAALKLVALCSHRNLVWEAVELGALCSHHSLVWEAVKFEAVCRLRIQRRVVRMAARQASEGVAPDEPVRSGMNRAEADQSDPGELVPCHDTASGQALL